MVALGCLSCQGCEGLAILCSGAGVQQHELRFGGEFVEMGHESPECGFRVAAGREIGQLSQGIGPFPFTMWDDELWQLIWVGLVSQEFREGFGSDCHMGRFEPEDGPEVDSRVSGVLSSLIQEADLFGFGSGFCWVVSEVVPIRRLSEAFRMGLLALQDQDSSQGGGKDVRQFEHGSRGGGKVSVSGGGASVMRMATAFGSLIVYYTKKLL